MDSTAFLRSDGTAVNSLAFGGLSARQFRAQQRTWAPADATTHVVDDTGNVGQQTSITIGAEGSPVVAYYDVDNGDLEIAHCDDVTCASANVFTADGGADDVGLHNVISLGSDGLVHVSYYDDTNAQCKLASCVDINCTDATITADTSTHRLPGGDIAAGADGGLITTYNFGGGGVAARHCPTPTCSTSSTTVIDDLEFVTDNAVAIGADGLPVISHWDGGRLLVTHCANLFCAPGFHRR